MPAMAYSTGPIDLFVGAGGVNAGAGLLAAAGAVGLGAGNQGIQLGTSKQGARVQFFHKYEPIMVDFAGTQIAYDKLYEGTYALVVLTLTRYSRTVFDALQAIPTPFGQAFTPGLESGLARGSMVLQEGLARTLWLRQTFAAGQPLAHAAMNNPATGALPAGWRFVGATLLGPDDESTGTGPHEIDIGFECLPVYRYQTRDFLLFDRSMAGLGAFL
jgi:hypothetical protein